MTIVTDGPEILLITNAAGEVRLSDLTSASRLDLFLPGYESLQIPIDTLISQSWQVGMKPLQFQFDEIVISGTRWRQLSGNVPTKITSIDPAEVSLVNPQTAADLLTLSGKVFVQKSQQGGGSPMIRGFATNRLLYTVDGVRMNTAIFRGGNIQNVINLDPFAIEKTEVAFGPGSVIYGSDAIGGVMSFTTLTPQYSQSEELQVNGSATIRYSSANNEKTGHVDAQLGWKNIALITSVSYWDYDHLRQGTNGPDDYLKPTYVDRVEGVDIVMEQDDARIQRPSAYDQFNVMQKLRLRPLSWLDIAYGFHFSETSKYGRYDRHNRIRDGLPQYGEWNYGPQGWQMHAVHFDVDKKTSLFDQFALRAAKQNFQESRINRNFGEVLRFSREEEVDAWSVNLDFTKKINALHQFNYGIEYVVNEVESTGISRDIETGETEAVAPRYPRSTWQSFGVFLNHTWKLHPKLNLQTGGRYNVFDIQSNFKNNSLALPFEEVSLQDGGWSGSTGLVYRPNDKWVAKVNLGTAFRAPNVDDIGKVFDSEPGAVTVPTPNLKSENAYNIDLGLAHIFNDRMKIDFSVYYTLLKQALVRRNSQLNGQDSILFDGVLSQIQTIRNAAEARVYGIQFGTEYKVVQGLKASIDINVQEGEEELDDGSASPSRHAAPYFGSFRVKYERGKFDAIIYSDFQGKRSFKDLAFEERNKDEIYAKDENGNNFSPSWCTINTKVKYKFSKHAEVTIGVENITDQRFRSYSSGISGAGRNYVLAVTGRL